MRIDEVEREALARHPRRNGAFVSSVLPVLVALVVLCSHTFATTRTGLDLERVELLCHGVAEGPTYRTLSSMSRLQLALKGTIVGDLPAYALEYDRSFEHGRVVNPPPEFYVEADCGALDGLHLAGPFRRDDVVGRTIDLCQEPRRTVSGRVSDIADTRGPARVTLFRGEYELAPRPVAADGTFEIDRVPAGDWLLRVESVERKGDGAWESLPRRIGDASANISIRARHDPEDALEITCSLRLIHQRFAWGYAFALAGENPALTVGGAPLRERRDGAIAGAIAVADAGSYLVWARIVTDGGHDSFLVTRVRIEEGARGVTWSRTLDFVSATFDGLGAGYLVVGDLDRDGLVGLSGIGLSRQKGQVTFTNSLTGEARLFDLGRRVRWEGAVLPGAGVVPVDALE